MKNFALLLSLLVFSICLTCSEDNPAGRDPDNGQLASEDIGPAGGTIDLSNIIIEIPSGAFSETERITLYVSAATSPFDSLLLTSKFRLEGLPENFAQPIDVYIKNGDTTSDTCLFALGQLAYSPDNDTTDFAYELIDVIDSSGWLHYQIPAAPISGKIAKSADQIIPVESLIYGIFGLYPNYVKTQWAFFDLYRHKEITAEFVSVANYLEDGLRKVKDLGYDLSASSNRKHRAYIGFGDANKIEVLILRDHTGNYYCQYNITVDKATGETNQDLEILVKSKQFHQVPILYHIPQAKLRWFSFAFTTWAEDYFTYPPSHCSEFYAGNELSPFKGVQGAIDQTGYDQKLHGYGLSTLLRFLTRQYTDNIIFNAMDYLKMISVHPLEALDLYTSDDINQWFPAYFRDLINGDPCAFDANTMISAKSGEFIINDAKDTLLKLDEAFYDLSARTYFIGLNYEDFGEEDIIKISATCDSIYTSDLDILVFSYKDNNLNFVKSGNQVTIENLNIFKAAGKHLVAVVVNSNMDDGYAFARVSDVDLKFEYQKPVGTTYEYCKIECKIKPEWQRYDGSTYWGVDYTLTFRFYGTTYNGVFTSAQPDVMWHGSNATGEMSVTFNTQTNDIISFNADISNLIGTNGRSDFSIAGENVPNSYSDSWLEAVVNGTGACSHISSLGYLNLYNITDNHYEMIKSFTCETNDHHITIELYDQD